jgi:molybdenum cofactor synthesis domain-containing protein
MPRGADAVIMVEESGTAADGRIAFSVAAQPGQNIGRQGADIQKGQTVLEAGAVLHASRVGALAALGLTAVDVFAKPRVAILSTGNEIVEPGQPLPPGQIYDINRFTLAAVIEDHGGIPVAHRGAADTIEDLSRAVDECLEEDVLVFSGGSSVGERDLILDIIAARGEMLFHGIAVKPGKPTAFGRIGTKLVFGMPGYPTSCLSNAYMLLTPLVRQIARLPEYHPHVVRLPLASRIVSTTGRHQFYTVRIVEGTAVPAFKASGDITSMSKADGYIEIPSQTDIVEAGEIVDVKLF